MKVLVIRNDKLGDFMLAWPALCLLKAQYPHARVTVLVPAYTSDMAALCEWVDDILIDERGEDSAFAGAVKLASRIRDARFDVSISLYSEMRTAFSLWLARVPERWGPATKLAQLFLNRTLRQRRSKSARPEYEYNADLVRAFIERQGDRPAAMPAPPYLFFDEDDLRRQQSEYRKVCDIDPASKLVIIHPGTGGSAINLSLQQYARLADKLAQEHRAHFIVTAGPGESGRAEKLSGLLAHLDHSVYRSTQGLTAFSRFIATCDLFISGSTGPLHIAGALNVKTAAFYPARRSATRLRWQTVNETDRRVSFAPVQHRGDDDMKTIDMDVCAVRIARLLAEDE